MTDKPSLSRRWNDLQASKTQLFWACAVCVVATMVIGFTWGGWVTGGTADKLASTAATGARAELAAAICVSRFTGAPDAKAKLASLKGAASYQQGDIIEKDGWVTIIGTDKPVAGAAALCVRQLLEAAPAATPVKAPS